MRKTLYYISKFLAFAAATFGFVLVVGSIIDLPLESFQQLSGSVLDMFVLATLFAMTVFYLSIGSRGTLISSALGVIFVILFSKYGSIDRSWVPANPSITFLFICYLQCFLHGIQGHGSLRFGIGSLTLWSGVVSILMFCLYCLFNTTALQSYLYSGFSLTIQPYILWFSLISLLVCWILFATNQSFLLGAILILPTIFLVVVYLYVPMVQLAFIFVLLLQLISLVGTPRFPAYE